MTGIAREVVKERFDISRIVMTGRKRRLHDEKFV